MEKSYSDLYLFHHQSVCFLTLHQYRIFVYTNYYGHFVNLQSSTPDYVDVTIYQTNDPYQGVLASFSFDFWTQELFFSEPVSDRLDDLILDAFKQLYRGAKVVDDENEEYPEE